ncbi:putative reverse transcriptase domain-containing protein [Tanacetum coccineum]
MAETVEQYMSKTRADYGSGVARPKIEEKDSFELKGKFLKGAIPSVTTADAKVAIQEIVEYSQKWHNGTSRARSPHYTKDYPLKEEGKTLEKAYYTQFGTPFQGGGSRATATGFYQRNNTNPSFQERRQSMEDTLSKFMGESEKRHEENSNLIKEMRKTLCHLNDYYWDDKKGSYGLQFSEAYGASHINNSIPRKEKDLGSFTLPFYINNACFDNALVDLGASVSVMPLLTYLNLGLDELAHTKLTVELADRTVNYPKGIAENVLVGIGKFTFPVDFIILDMPEDIKVPLIFGRPFLSTAHAKIDVYKRKITLRVGRERIIFKSVKPASSVIKRVYMLSLRERMELDLEATLMGETLVLNRSLDPMSRNYIELNDLNVPIKLKRDQVDDLMPTIEEGEVVEEFKARNDRMINKVFWYPSDHDHDKKKYIEYSNNLKFSCMIDKLEYKGNNIVGALMNVPIFVGTFSVITNFAVLEDMDDYRDEEMGDDLMKRKSMDVGGEFTKSRDPEVLES